MIEPVMQRLGGVAGMLALRPGWRARFEVSPEAYRRSFLATIPAAPLFVLSIAGQNAVSAGLAGEDGARPVDLAQGLVLFVCLWAYFPLVARIFVRVFHLQDSFHPWVVVHNWTVLFLLAVQAAIGALVLAGVMSPMAYAQIGEFYFLFAIYAHCRVAAGALDAPWPLAVGGACVGILVWLIAQLLLVYVFAGAALQA